MVVFDCILWLLEVCDDMQRLVEDSGELLCALYW